MGLDEQSFLRGQGDVSLMTDLDGRRMLEVVPDRSTVACVKLREALPKEQRAKIVAAAMDMGAPFIIGTTKAVPPVDIVPDRFHVSKSLNEAVDKTRREESLPLAAKGDDTLKRTRFRWLLGQTPDAFAQPNANRPCRLFQIQYVGACW